MHHDYPQRGERRDYREHDQQGRFTGPRAQYDERNPRDEDRRWQADRGNGASRYGSADQNDHARHGGRDDGQRNYDVRGGPRDDGSRQNPRSLEERADRQYRGAWRGDDYDWNRERDDGRYTSSERDYRGADRDYQGAERDYRGADRDYRGADRDYRGRSYDDDRVRDGQGRFTGSYHDDRGGRSYRDADGQHVGRAHDHGGRPGFQGDQRGYDDRRLGGSFDKRRDRGPSIRDDGYARRGWDDSPRR